MAAFVWALGGCELPDRNDRYAEPKVQEQQQGTETQPVPEFGHSVDPFFYGGWKPTEE